MWEIAEQLIEWQIEWYLDEDWCYIWENDKEERRQKKRNNYESSLKILDNRWVKYKKSWPSHIILENFDFYPSTWLFINKKTKERWRWVFNLLKKL